MENKTDEKSDKSDSRKLKTRPVSEASGERALRSAGSRQSAIEKAVATLAENEVEEFDIEKGGIYIELTYDPRGFFLGDKTRRRFKASIDQISFLTNLNISVYIHWDGIKVAVNNTKEIGRMLTSKNDDVGSVVEYAKYDGSSPVELSAQPGQHVCIESMTNGSYIRVLVFPGKNVIKDYDDKEKKEAERNQRSEEKQSTVAEIAPCATVGESKLEDIRNMCQSAIEEIDKVIALEFNVDKSFETFIEKARKSEIGGLKRPNFFPYIQELNLQKQILLTLKFHIECQIDDKEKK